MKISLIAAMAENRVIGLNNKLPWNLPADLAWFKKQTLNKPIVMGRKTWESLPFKPLPGRDNIIITRDANYQAKNKKNERVSSAIVCISVTEAINYALSQGCDELMFIGGASLYTQVLDRVDYLYLTWVKGEFSGDAWFPEIDFSQWQESFSERHEADKNNLHSYQFSIYQRR